MDTTNVNMHPLERRVSAALGSALLLRNLTRHSLGETVLAATLLYRGVSGHSYLYQILGVSTADKNKQHGTGTADDAAEGESSITIGKTADELYRFLRQPQSFSQIMGDIAEVTEVSKDRAHWVLRGPLNLHMEWDTQIVEDRPGELLRWKSLDGASLPNEDSVRFRPAPGDRGTEVLFHFRFEPPGGTLGSSLAKRLNIVPHMIAEKALRRFKSLAETGEFPTLEHNPSARVGTHADA